MLAGYEAVVFAGGHTHIPLLRRFGQLHVINPGSVGLPGVGPGGPDLPVNTDVTWAEYAILDLGANTISVEFRQVPLDLQAMRQRVIESTMPHAEWWFGRWGLR